ncbi:MAG: hypothetical protein KJ884_22460, partial [Gammaproteobacteria bacterium]|nr:hypothetical protein [Gammaproteobacteria bacterium]
TTLAAMQTELQQKLETADLNIEAGSKDLQVDVKSSALPTDAATQTTLAAMQTELQQKLETADLLLDAAKRLAVDLYGWDTTTWQKVRTDVDGYTLVRVWSSELPDDAATQTTLAAMQTELQAKLETADLNLDGTKDLQVDVKTIPTVTVQAAGGDKIFAFESIVEEALSNTNLSAGQNSLVGTVVPAGKVWKITHATMTYVGTVPTEIYIQVSGLATALGLIYQAAPASDRIYIWEGEIYMQEADYFICFVSGATAGDALYMRYAGVQMNAP